MKIPDRESRLACGGRPGQWKEGRARPDRATAYCLLREMQRFVLFSPRGKLPDWATPCRIVRLCLPLEFLEEGDL